MERRLSQPRTGRRETLETRLRLPTNSVIDDRVGRSIYQYFLVELTENLHINLYFITHAAVLISWDVARPVSSRKWLTAQPGQAPFIVRVRPQTLGQKWQFTPVLSSYQTFFPNFIRILPSKVLCFLVYMCFRPWSWFKRQREQNRNCPFTSSVDSAILENDLPYFPSSLAKLTNRWSAVRRPGLFLFSIWRQLDRKSVV